MNALHAEISEVLTSMCDMYYVCTCIVYTTVTENSNDL